MLQTKSCILSFRTYLVYTASCSLHSLLLSSKIITCSPVLVCGRFDIQRAYIMVCLRLEQHYPSFCSGMKTTWVRSLFQTLRSLHREYHAAQLQRLFLREVLAIPIQNPERCICVAGSFGAFVSTLSTQHPAPWRPFRCAAPGSAVGAWLGHAVS